MTRLFLACMGVLFSILAQANMYDLYRADYAKGSFCSVIGGACAASTDFDSSFFQNPASLTAGGSNWDYDYDLVKGNNFEPGLKKNNKVEQTTFLAAVAYSKRNFGIGLSFSQQMDTVQAVATFSDDAAGTPAQFNTNTSATTIQINMPVSVRVTPRYHLGATLIGIFQKPNLRVDGVNSSASSTSQAIPAIGVAIGGIWKKSSHFRTGGWIRTPITYYYSQHISTRSAFTQFNYDEDVGINYPFMWAFGGAWMPWGDATTISFDLNVVGTTDNGYLLSYDNFATSKAINLLLPKGRNTVVDPRVGLSTPWFRQSNGTLSLGSYYENSRWQGYEGIWHFTGGLAYKMPWVKFLMFDGVELMIGADVAKNYQAIYFTYR